MSAVGRRSDATSLTDDELTILDVLFECSGCPAVLLRRETFYSQWLLRHSLSDHELLELIDRFVANGWLTQTPPPTTGRLAGQASYGITAAGGKLWEMERRPDWDRYATDSYCGVPSPRPSVTIQAFSKRTCEEFWRIGKEVGYFHHTDGKVRQFAISDNGLIPWKWFERVHVLIAFLDDEISSRCCWSRFEEQRTWWRRSWECAKFFPVD
ncbi:MAG TPA: hypothetical protein VM452_00500 [Caulifigura sp.]|nr:hypothetical protein [Caulifigura sp.]